MESHDEPTGGSGRGGPMGTPSGVPAEAPPDVDQEENAVVSGGGLVGPDDEHGPSEEARHSPSSQAP